ncbi:MAG: hypothetical protein ACK55Z_06910, partial [bacterium]
SNYCATCHLNESLIKMKRRQLFSATAHSKEESNQDSAHQASNEEGIEVKMQTRRSPDQK